MHDSQTCILVVSLVPKPGRIYFVFHCRLAWREVWTSANLQKEKETEENYHSMTKIIITLETEWFLLPFPTPTDFSPTLTNLSFILTQTLLFILQLEDDVNPVGVCLHLYVRFVSKPEQLFSLLQTLYRTENQKTAWLELVGVSHPH